MDPTCTCITQWLTRPKLDPLEMISENKAVIGFNLIWLWDQGRGDSIHSNEDISLDLRRQGKETFVSSQIAPLQPRLNTYAHVHLASKD